MSSLTSSSGGPLCSPLLKDNYKVICPIGTGAYGTVYKAEDRKIKGRYVALKQIQSTSSEEGIPLSTIREIAMLRQIDAKEHPNIVRLFDAFPLRVPSRGTILSLVFEFMDMDLSTYLEKSQSTGLTNDKVKDMMEQLLSGVEFLHTHRIVHRDIKPQNILLKDGRLKLADFGLARIYNNMMALTSVVVTLWYRSPEVLLQGSYDTSVDIWSCGCIFAELIRRKALFIGQSDIDQLHKIFDIMGLPDGSDWPDHVTIPRKAFKDTKKQDLRKFVPNITDVALDLLEKMLVFNLDKRISASECLRHIYIREETYSETECSESDELSDDSTVEGTDSDSCEDMVDGPVTLKTNLSIQSSSSDSGIVSDRAEDSNNNDTPSETSFSIGTPKHFRSFNFRTATESDFGRTTMASRLRSSDKENKDNNSLSDAPKPGPSGLDLLAVVASAAQVAGSSRENIQDKITPRGLRYSKRSENDECQGSTTTPLGLTYSSNEKRGLKRGRLSDGLEDKQKKKGLKLDIKPRDSIKPEVSSKESKNSKIENENESNELDWKSKIDSMFENSQIDINKDSNESDWKSKIDSMFESDNKELEFSGIELHCTSDLDVSDDGDNEILTVKGAATRAKISSFGIELHSSSMTNDDKLVEKEKIEDKIVDCSDKDKTKTCDIVLDCTSDIDLGDTDDDS